MKKEQQIAEIPENNSKVDQESAGNELELLFPSSSTDVVEQNHANSSDLNQKEKLF
jgi:hypothetical protein